MDDKEVAIIGMGPAGVSASIYLSRYGMTPFCFEKELVGGKVNKTEKIENYAGVVSIDGPKLGLSFEQQLSSMNIEPIYKEVKEVSLNEDGSFKVIYGRNIIHDFKYVILSNGLKEKPFPIKGEDSFNKRGISRCAICDGALYKGKNVAVIGSGNSAFEEAIYLASITNHVTLLARREEYRAQPSVVEKFKSLPNTDIISPVDIISVDGNSSIENIHIYDKKNEKEIDLPLQGLFIYVGDEPSLSFLNIPTIKSENGYIVVDDKKKTNIENLYAIGDCRVSTLRQVATAVSDGAIAANEIYLDYQRKN